MPWEVFFARRSSADACTHSAPQVRHASGFHSLASGRDVCTLRLCTSLQDTTFWLPASSPGFPWVVSNLATSNSEPSQAVPHPMLMGRGPNSLPVSLMSFGEA